MAEDLAQETFLKVLQAADSYRPGARFKPWLYKIATNLCLNEVRRAKRQNVQSLNETFTLEITDQDEELLELHELLPDETATPPDQAVLRAEAHARVRRALASLSDAHRETVRLRFYEDLQYEAIAERLNCSLGTVKSRLHYALRRMRELLQQEEER
jgi:RNA polymerase sigma-70 factor (ECF subfamily)